MEEFNVDNWLKENVPKSCPFCGSLAQITAFRIFRTRYRVSCTNRQDCGIEQAGTYRKKEAIEKWNRRYDNHST